MRAIYLILMLGAFFVLPDRSGAQEQERTQTSDHALGELTEALITSNLSEIAVLLTKHLTSADTARFLDFQEKLYKSLEERNPQDGTDKRLNQLKKKKNEWFGFFVELYAFATLRSEEPQSLTLASEGEFYTVKNSQKIDGLLYRLSNGRLIIRTFIEVKKSVFKFSQVQNFVKGVQEDGLYVNVNAGAELTHFAPDAIDFEQPNGQQIPITDLTPSVLRTATLLVTTRNVGQGQSVNFIVLPTYYGNALELTYEAYANIIAGRRPLISNRRPTRANLPPKMSRSTVFLALPDAEKVRAFRCGQLPNYCPLLHHIVQRPTSDQSARVALAMIVIETSLLRTHDTIMGQLAARSSEWFAVTREPTFVAEADALRSQLLPCEGEWSQTH